jgi:phage terminase large subunit
MSEKLPAVISAEAPGPRSAVDPSQKPAFWLPRLSPKQMSVFNDFHRFILLSGPRKSSKSWASCHRILRHCFDTPHAEVIMVSRNIKTAKEGGIWSYLVDQAIEEWRNAGITDYVKAPRQDGQTRTLFCTIRNRYGGESKIMLNSLDYDDDAERLFKERAVTAIYFSELSKWRKRKVFDVSIMSLRKPGVPYSQMMWLADTNPGDDGEDEWYYQLFEVERTMESVPDWCKTPADIERFRKRQKELSVHNIYLNDNIFLTQDEIDDVINSHAHDPDLYARYVEGRYVKASGDGFFSALFKPAVHIMGNCQRPNRSEWEVITLDETAISVDVGWDIGDRNTAVAFVYSVPDEKKINEYYIVDEVVVLDDQVSLDAIVDAVIQKMDALEKQVGHPLKFFHWSDTSSFAKRISAENTEAMLVHHISHGRITLNPSTKWSGSLNDGISMFRRLFFENRLKISAHCFQMIQAIRGLKPERARGSGVQKIAENFAKHSWDAARYAINMRESRDLTMRRPRISKPGRIVSLG